MKDKRCSRCGKIKSLEEFYKDSNTRDGKRRWCKSCIKQYSKQWQQENKEKVKQYQKQWYLENKEKVKQASKQWQQENKERAKQTSKQWRQENEEKVKQARKQYYLKNKEKAKRASKKWQQNNKEKVKQYKKQWYLENEERFKQTKKRWRLENPNKILNSSIKRRKYIVDQEITKEEWQLVMESCDWRCFYCGTDLTLENRTVDHWVPLSRGGDHAIHNLVPACRSCNSSKNDKLYSEWAKEERYSQDPMDLIHCKSRPF